MALPNVIIALGNGNMGRSAATADGVAGLLLTGSAVSEKLELGKHLPAFLDARPHDVRHYGREQSAGGQGSKGILCAGG